MRCSFASVSSLLLPLVLSVGQCCCVAVVLGESKLDLFSVHFTFFPESEKVVPLLLLLRAQASGSSLVLSLLLLSCYIIA